MHKMTMLALAAAATIVSGAALAQAPATPAAPAPAPTPPPTTPYGLAIGIDDAKQAAVAAVAKAKEVSGAPDAIAIVGPGGDLIYFERMDNTQPGSVETAIKKARSAALFRRPTKAFADALGRGLMGVLALPDAIPLEGGLPLIRDGHIVGAIGASGGTGAQDGQVAAAGAGTIK